MKLMCELYSKLQETVKPGKPGVLLMGLQRVGHNLATEHQHNPLNLFFQIFIEYFLLPGISLIVWGRILYYIMLYWQVLIK